jgi:hypothetical protein
MYRTFGQKTRRPVFKTAAQEAAENRAIDAKLERQDAERRERLNTLIAESQAQKSAVQIAAEAETWNRVLAKAADETRRQQNWLDRRRREQDSSLSLGT